MRKYFIYILMAGILLFGACSDNDGDILSPTYSDVSISFSTEVETDTRVYTGSISDISMLQYTNAGFGVFAYWTGTDEPATLSQTWDDVTKDGSGNRLDFKDYPVPDFMYNQAVTWGLQYVDTEKEMGVYDWMYSPLKYWPNSTDNATPRYISFFAYAPYTSETEASSTGSAGVIGFPSTGDKSPHVQYRLYTTEAETKDLVSVGDQVDFLYAEPVIDATRNGDGLIEVDDEGKKTYQKVPLVFHHALSYVDIYVQRIYDNTVPNADDPDEADDTKIFVNSISFEPLTDMWLKTGGTFDLEKSEWREGDFTPKTLPEKTTAITLTTEDFTERLRGTAATDASAIRVYELDKWNNQWKEDGTKYNDIDDSNYDKSLTVVSGVTEMAQKINLDTRMLMFMPQSITLTPTVSYSFVTHDDALEHDYLIDTDGANGNNSYRYSRILTTATGNPIKLDLEPGKRYALLCQISVEHVSFQVTDVEDWDFPIRFTPSVEPYGKQTLPHTVNEGH